MKNLIRKLLYTSRFYELRRRLHSRADKRLIIMMYHDLIEDIQVGDRTDFWGGKPTRSQFAAHLKALTRFCRVISVEDAVDEITKHGKLAEDSAAITFDDGYASVYRIAFPLLKEYNLPATVFVLTDWINNKLTLWWEELAAMFDAADFKTIDSAEICRIFGLEPNDKLTKLSYTKSVKRKIQNRIEIALRDKADDERRGLIDRLKTVLIKDNNSLPTGAKPMTWIEIREMAEAGIRFDAHTCSHINLRHANRDLIEKEIAQSKREVERHINQEVKGFAYPYGQDLAAYDKIEHILRQYNYVYACTTCPGANDSRSNRFLLRRITLPLTTSTTVLKGILIQQWVRRNDNPLRKTVTI
jgi:peptidoglycan/xylan/chitin deacetylase (PgdA/CDA1 family)